MPLTSECSSLLSLCRGKLLGMLTFGPTLSWTFLLAAHGGSKATELPSSFYPSVYDELHIIRLGNSHPQQKPAGFYPGMPQGMFHCSQELAIKCVSCCQHHRYIAQSSSAETSSNDLSTRRGSYPPHVETNLTHKHTELHGFQRLVNYPISFCPHSLGK